MAATAVLLLTHDEAVWEHWCSLDSSYWLPTRARHLADLSTWKEQGNQLVILDADLPGLPTWSETGWQKFLPSLSVIVASMQPSDTEGKQALSAGAKGYIHAYMPVQALHTVLQTVQQGGVWMGSTLLARLLRDINQRLPEPATKATAWQQHLTAREIEVAQRAALGHSNQAIAQELHITERTVRAHLSTVFSKLGVQDRLQLALKVHGVAS